MSTNEVPNITRLYAQLRAAIAHDAQVHPVSGRPNRDHWEGILQRHQSGGIVDGYDRPFCSGCGWDGEDPRYLMPCPEIEALARRLRLDEDDA